MLSRIALYSVSILLMILIAACQPAGTTSTPSLEITPRGETTQTPEVMATSTTEGTEEERTSTPEMAATMEMTGTPTITSTLTSEQLLIQGKEVFTANCSTCHGLQGEGSADFPALANNAAVTATQTMTMTQFVIHGRDGKHNFGDKLNDGEIAAVLTYIRNSWGNEGTPVTEEEVRLARETPSPTSTP